MFPFQKIATDRPVVIIAIEEIFKRHNRQWSPAPLRLKKVLSFEFADQRITFHIVHVDNSTLLNSTAEPRYTVFDQHVQV